MNKQTIKSLFKLSFAAGLLKRVIRTGWQRKNVKDPESVAEHSFRVAVMAMCLAPKFNLNEEKLLKMALIHDLGESIIGDLIWERGEKVIGSQKEKHKDEEKAVKDIFEGNERADEFISIWNEFKNQNTKESKLLKQIDKLEMTMQAYEYEQEGSDPSVMEEFWVNAGKYLEGKELEPLFREVNKLRED